MKKTKNGKSTYEREMEDPKFRRLFEKAYGELLLSELIHALMDDDKVSVRKLAKEVGIAPSVLQSVRSGKHTNLTLKNFIKILTALGAEIAVKKGNEYFPIHLAA